MESSARAECWALEVMIISGSHATGVFWGQILCHCGGCVGAIVEVSFVGAELWWLTQTAGIGLSVLSLYCRPIAVGCLHCVYVHRGRTTTIPISRGRPHPVRSDVTAASLCIFCCMSTRQRADCGSVVYKLGCYYFKPNNPVGIRYFFERSGCSGWVGNIPS